MRYSLIIMFGAILAAVAVTLAGCVAPPSSDAPPAGAPGTPLRGSADGAGSCSNDADCVVGGCSGTLCTQKDAPPMMSTCEWREEYACYKTIPCGCVEGACAWKTTPEFDSCIREKSTITP